MKDNKQPMEEIPWQSMNINDIHTKAGMVVMRVPGGWVMNTWSVEDGELGVSYSESSVFIPYVVEGSPNY